MRISDLHTPFFNPVNALYLSQRMSLSRVFTGSRVEVVGWAKKKNPIGF